MHPTLKAMFQYHTLYYFKDEQNCIVLVSHLIYLAYGFI